jgi:hypothetical protein
MAISLITEMKTIMIILNNKTIDQVQSFNFLGFDIFFNYDRDLSQKIYKLQYACGTIKRTLRTKTRRYNVEVPMLMYGSENWTMNRADRRRVEVAEMKFLRYVAGYTLKDQVRNDNIRQQLGMARTHFTHGQKKNYSTNFTT